MAKQWEEMTPDEKQEVMFEKWLSPEDVEFKSPEAEKSYKERVTRIKDAVQLKKKPDRVPVFPFVGFFPAFYAGITAEEAMYDYDKLYSAAKKYVLDFEPDAHASLFVQGPGKVFDILDYKLYAWPSHGVSPNHGYQCLDAEYMKADEYDDLIQDPSYFFTSTYFPRIFGKLEPFKMLSPLTGILELPFTGPVMFLYGMPEVQAAYKAFLEAGSESLKWVGYLLDYNKEMAESGFPLFYGWFTKAPFDVIGDTLRGTRGIMLDMYRHPDKLIQALEAITPLTIKLGVTMAKANGRPLVLIPLHKGADGFMSDEQFKTFYWPTFRKMLMGIIDEGCVPFLYAEGGYNSRLEIIKDLPRGKTIWSFDTTDMAKAKKILGDVACIGGNMPVSLLTVGTPQEVKDYTKKLIDTAGKNGGYIMVSGVVIDEAKPENLKAMIDATKEYGVYKQIINGLVRIWRFSPGVWPTSSASGRKTWGHMIDVYQKDLCIQGNPREFNCDEVLDLLKWVMHESYQKLLITRKNAKVEINMEKETKEITENDEPTTEEPQILKEIIIEELSIDGVCGVY